MHNVDTGPTDTGGEDDDALGTLLDMDDIDGPKLSTSTRQTVARGPGREDTTVDDTEAGGAEMLPAGP